MKNVNFENVQELLDNGKKPEEVFDVCHNFREGFVCVRLNGKYNYIGKNRKLLSPNQWFDYTYDFYEGFAVVRLNEKWNFINKNGKIVFPNQWFDCCGYFHEGFGKVQLNGKWNYIDQNGNLYDKSKQPLNVNISKKNYSLIKGEENSVFVWCSFFSDANFEEIPSNDNYIVVITNNKTRLITIYNCEGFTEEEKEELVKRHCQFLTSGCNYTYELKRKVGNCYFCS